MPAKGLGPTIVAASNGPVFDSVGVEQFIEIQVEGEDVTGVIVRGPHGFELHIAPVGAPGPIANVDLAIGRQIEALLFETIHQSTFAMPHKAAALLMNEINLAVQCRSTQPCDLHHSSQRHLVDQKPEHGDILMRLALLTGRLANRERRSTRLAAKPRVTVTTGPMRVVALAMRFNAASVVCALGVGAAGFVRRQVGRNPLHLAVDAPIALGR